MARKRGGITLRDESSNEKTLKECKRTQSLQKNAKAWRQMHQNCKKTRKPRYAILSAFDSGFLRSFANFAFFCIFFGKHDMRLISDKTEFCM